MKTKKNDINAEVDWDQLDTFLADQYEADYGHYFSISPDTSFSDILRLNQRSCKSHNFIQIPFPASSNDLPQ